MAHICLSCTRLTSHPSLPCTTFVSTRTSKTLDSGSTSCSAADGATSAVQLLRCIDDFNRWMCSNRLKLNSDKTQFIWHDPPRQHQQVSSLQLIVNGVPMSPADAISDPASPLTLSCRSSSTSTASYIAAFINCDSYSQSDDQFQMTLRAPGACVRHKSR